MMLGTKACDYQGFSNPACFWNVMKVIWRPNRGLSYHYKDSGNPAPNRITLQHLGSSDDTRLENISGGREPR